MKKIIPILICFILVSGLFGESATTILPLLFYQTNNLDGLKSSFYGGGLVLNHLKDKEDASIEPEGFSSQFTYIMDNQKENSVWEQNKNTLNQIFFQGVYKTGNHQGILIAQDNSDKPFSSKYGTTLAAAYGYQLCDNQKWSCYVGGGLFMAPVQIGTLTLPVIPLPIVRAAYKSEQVYAAFDFLGSPSLNCLFFTQNHFRVAVNLQCNGLSSVRDISGQIALKYYFFPEHDILQVLNLQLGVENTVMSYGLKDDRTYRSQNWGAFAAFDAGVLKIFAGYSFDGQQKINDIIEKHTGEGWYFSTQVMFVF